MRPPDRGTRDASDRLLPPEPRRSPARRSFPTPRTAFAIRDAPRRSVVVTWHDRGTGRFHDARDRFGPNATNTRPRERGLATADSRARACWTRGAHEKSPLTPLSRYPLRLRAHAPSCGKPTPAARGERGTWFGSRREPPRPPLPKVREDQTAEDDPRCLSSTGTLRRIRWPLQPRSRDPRTAFGGCECRWMTLSRHPGP